MLRCGRSMACLIFLASVSACGGSRARARTVRHPVTTSAVRPPSLTRRFLDWTGLSSRLPRRPDGSISLLQIADSRLEINPSLHDPLTALGACADLVTACYGPAMPLDQCVTGVRACTSNEPWHEDACCPVSCRDRYAHERQSGRAPLDAFETVFFREPDCFPGVRPMLVRSP